MGYAAGLELIGNRVAAQETRLTGYHGSELTVAVRRADDGTDLRVDIGRRRRRKHRRMRRCGHLDGRRGCHDGVRRGRGHLGARRHSTVGREGGHQVFSTRDTSRRLRGRSGVCRIYSRFHDPPVAIVSRCNLIEVGGRLLAGTIVFDLRMKAVVLETTLKVARIRD